MPEARLARTRRAYLCGRRLVLTPWLHCSCKACDFARNAPREYNRLMSEPSTGDEGWGALEPIPPGRYFFECDGRSFYIDVPAQPLPTEPRTGDEGV